MNAGYVRLSKDDEKRNSSSIENQKLIIQQYAADHNTTIDRWYEDDGISGYLFNRPGFQQLLNDLDTDIDAVYVKDFSRLGRHNAKILLLLDKFQEHGKRLIAIDDHYDSINTDNDMIGIQTWFNERYVKDTSKKIKHAIHAKQKDGTLLTNPPFGYRRNPKNQNLLEIIPEEACWIKEIYHLYLSGYGYRKISIYLSEQGIPTPSMIQHERQIKNGHISKRAIAHQWSDSMVRDILNNDFYIGTFRLRKRARSTVHGKDRRIPKDSQYLFPDHHPAIIEKSTFSLVQELKEKRQRNNYRGNTNLNPSKLSKNPQNSSLFQGLLFCKDCGHPLTPIKRRTSKQTYTYYVCSTYNSKGKRYCPKSHLIREDALLTKTLSYFKEFRTTFPDELRSYHFEDELHSYHFQTKIHTYNIEETLLQNPQRTLSRSKLSKEIEQQLSSSNFTKEIRLQLTNKIQLKKEQLKLLLSQKIRDLSISEENQDLIEETYQQLQNQLLEEIHNLEKQSKVLQENQISENTPISTNILDVLDDILNEKALSFEDIPLFEVIHFFIKKIIVDKDGTPEFILNKSLTK